MSIRCEVLVVALLIGGCASTSTPTPHDTEFAPIEPYIPPAPPNEYGSLYNPINAGFLFEDRRARRVGDVLTIRITENMQAQKKADTKIKKDDKADFEPPTILGAPITFKGKEILNLDAQDKREFKAESDSKQSNSLSGMVTVTVTNILSNGYLVIRGDKWVTINQGEEFVRLTGIVRPEDIGPDNSVLSTRVANARIAYSGTGQMAEANSRGWLSRFFNTDWWPL